jgi:hypothetical protein
MSELKVNKISPRSGTDVTLGDSGDAISVASGASLTSPGLTLSDNILFNAASKGIYLGVTSATASNLLDDYEEGTWTPTGLPFTISNTTGAQPGGPISLAYRFAAGTSGYFFQLNGGTNTTSAFIYRTTPNVTTPILLQGSDFITGGNRNSLNALLIYQTD